MSRISQFASPFLLGFDELEQIMDRVQKGASDGYPPYNIEKLPGDEKTPDKYRITIAVAGFSRQNLSISVENQQLVVRGNQKEANENTFLHRGIATRQFQRSFVLADGIEVGSADLKNGLLSIDLEQPKPASNHRNIEIRDAELIEN